MPKLFNTYIEGMDRDTSFSHYSNKRYYNARNMRPIDSSDMSFSELKTVLGNSATGIDFGSGRKIIGYGEFRDYGIVITTNCTTENPGGVNPDVTADPASTGTMWKIDFSAGTKTSVYASIPNVTTKHPINYEVYCYYDNEDRQKVYWADHFNLLRHINTEDPPSSADKLDIVADIELSQAYLKAIGSGNLNVGVVQYAYQLYDLGGGETIFSPASPLYTISESNEFAANTKEYKGSSKLDSNGNLTNSGKSFNVQIDNIDTSFDKIKIVSIHYSTVDSTPTINVVSILDVSSSVNIWDSGSYQLGTMSLGEFRTLGGNLIIPKTLSVKDNILFAGNIKQKYFDVDFDARAYRFRNYNSSIECQVWNSGTLYQAITKSGTWPNATFKIGYSNVAENANCVNPYNYAVPSSAVKYAAPYADDNPATEDSWAKFVYQSDGSTIGGEGPNVKYEIRSYNSFTIMHTPYDGDYYVNKTGETDHDSLTSKPNPTASFRDYANPYMKRFLGYKRNEIYRFGIVFFNNKGQQSFVKWIGDIKMPINSQFQIANPLGPPIDRTDIYELMLDFYVDTSDLSSDVAGYQIVRVKREEKDKTIVASGILNNTCSGSPSYAPPIPSYRPTTNYNSYRKLLTFISPEGNYYKNLSYNVGDTIFAEGTMGWKIFKRIRGNYRSSDSGYSVLEGTGNEIKIIPEYRHSIQVTYKGIGKFGTTEGVYKTVEDGRMFEPCNEANYESNIVTINGDEYTNYVRLGLGTPYQRGPAGTQYVLGVDSEMSYSILGSDAHDVFYVDYIRNNANIIYGGMYYANRQLNEYIPAGEYVKIADLPSAGPNWDPRMTVWGGDTYIHMFEHLMVAMDAEDYDGDDSPDLDIEYRINSWVRFPCESTINLPLTYGETHRRNKTGVGTGIGLDPIHEVAGEYLTNTNWNALTEGTYVQTEDMYLYNSVYSQQNTSKTYYPEPADWAAIKDYDTLVYNSDTKMKGSDIDAWLKFRVNNEIDLDSSYGPLQKLLLFKTNMIFFQDNAFGTLSIRQRQLLQTEGGGSLELGSGGILDRFDLLSIQDGCQHPTAIVATNMGFYWYDNKKKRFNMYSGKLENLSVSRGMFSYSKNIPDEFSSYTNIINGTGIIATHNEKFHEVLFSFKNADSNEDETVVFNEMSGKYTGFYDIRPTFYMQNKGKLYTSYSLQTIYEENAGNPANWFGQTYDVVLELIINPNNGVVNVFNNFEYYSRVLNSGGDEQNTETWDKIQMLNSYQDSGEITIVSGTNIKRRMRMWRFKDFRDNTNRRIRFRDEYVKLIFTYIPGGNRIIMHDLATYFSVPAESLAR